MTPAGKWFDMHQAKDMPLSKSSYDPLTDAPGHAAGRTDSLASSIDLAPTLADESSRGAPSTEEI